MHDLIDSAMREARRYSDLSLGDALIDGLAD
jgi:hypothetical protein